MYDLIQIAMRLTGAKEAAAEAELASGAIASTGDAAVTANATSRSATSRMGSLWSRFGSIVKAGALAGVAGLGALVWKIHGAVEESETLAKTTVGLHRNLGLTNAAASRWGVIAQARDIDTRSLNMSFTTLSRQIVAAKEGGDAYNNTFGKLGITHKQVADGTKNFTGIVMNLADAFGQAKGGAERQAIAQQLLGRGYQSILPLFSQGSKALREQLGWADKYGATMGRGDVKDTMEMVQAQRELNVAMIGLNEQLARAVIPTLVKMLPSIMNVVRGIGQFIAGMDNGEGAGGKFAAAMRGVGTAIGWTAGKIGGLISAGKSLVSALQGDGKGAGDLAKDLGAIGKVALWIDKQVFSRLLAGTKDLLSGLGRMIGNIVDIFKGLVRVVGGILRGDWADAWKGAKQIVSGFVGFAINLVKTLTAPFRSVFMGLGSFVLKGFKAVEGPVVSILNFVIDRINNLIDAHNALPFLPDIPNISNIGETIPMPTVTNARRASSGPNNGVADYGNSPSVRPRPAVRPRQTITPRSTASSRPRRVTREQPIILQLDGRTVAGHILQIGDTEAVLA